MNKKSRLILVDGSAYIFRAYYGLPPMNRADGTPINAVFGFTNMLVKLIEDYSNDKMIVIFDAARENFRNEIYSEYKANRGEAPDDLIPQFPLIRECVKSFNIPQLEMEGFEADDLIATYVKLAKKDEIETIIVSSDKDLMQLYRKNVRIYDPMKNKFINEEDVNNKFGVKPEKVVDVQALAGDSTDNVPGVPGIGVKTAAELINEYGNLENLLKNAKKIKQNKRRETLIENSDKAIISKKLVELKNDVPVKNSISEFGLKQIDKKKLYNFLREMEFNRLLSSAISKYGESEFENNEPNIKEKYSLEITNKNYEIIKNEDELRKFLKNAEEIGEFSIDTETNSLDPHQASLVGISISSSIGYAFYIPLNHLNTKNFDEKNILSIFKPYLEDKSIKKIGQNIKFDYIIFYHRGIDINSMEDTMLMSYVLDAGKNRHNMDTLSEIHLDHKTIKFKDIVGTGKKQINFSEVDLEVAKNYASEDADITYRLYKIFLKSLKSENLINIYEIFEKPLIKILAMMEINGIGLDKGFLKKLSSKFSNKIEQFEKKIYKISNKKFNIASTKQLGEIMYNELKISSLKKTKKGSFATSASVLEDLAFKGHELPKLVLDWRQTSKLKNTYSDSLPEHLNSKTNRVHTSFLLAATTTGRLASSDPNLQNIPIKSEDGRDIRKAFISEKDKKLISADYNQIEMRILADLADVKALKKAFLNSEDIHSLTASQVFGVEIKKVNSEMRRKAKAINFGIIYGISQYGLAKQIGVSNNEAEEFLNSYFQKFPEIKEYMNSTIKFCRKSGYVQNIFGRKTHIIGINDKNFNVRNFQERAAINAPIQGSASEIMRLAMIRLNSELNLPTNQNLKMLLQIHDELIFETNINDLKKSSKLISDIMMSVKNSEQHSFSIPLLVDVNSGKNWGELH